MLSQISEKCRAGTDIRLVKEMESVDMREKISKCEKREKNYVKILKKDFTNNITNVII